MSKDLGYCCVALLLAMVANSEAARSAKASNEAHDQLHAMD